MRQYGDAAPEFGDVQMLVRRVIERRVARPVSHHRALPHRADGVHIRRAGLEFEARLAALSADRFEQRAHRRRVLVGLVRGIAAAESQLCRAGPGFHFRLQRIDAEIRRKTRHDRHFHVIVQPVAVGAQVTQRGIE